MKNNKRYWLRGVILIILIFVLISVLLIPFGMENSCFICFPYWLYPSIYACIAILYPLYSLGIKTPSLDFNGTYLLVIAFSFIIYFVIGAVLGWIYGKVKNRNKFI